MKSSVLKSLQSMRFFAALGVVQFHLWQNYFNITIGHSGTDFFLVLVGVVAAYTQAKHISDGSWWKYISDRYKRLYVTFIPLFVIALLAKQAEADLQWILKSFFFVPIADRAPVIGCTWMLSMFVLFYFLFSLCFLFKNENILWVVFGLWTILMILYNFSLWKPDLPAEWSNLFFAERNFDFIMGYIVGIILRLNGLKSDQARMLLWTGLVGIVGGTILLNTGWNSMRVLTIGFPIALFVLGLATLEQKKTNDSITNVLTTPWLVWLGRTSYVIYLSHSMFFQVWKRILPVTQLWALPMTIGAILLGALGYAFWEYPVLTYLKRGKWMIHRVPGISMLNSKPWRDNATE